jgi:hypothetical protein
MNSFISQQTMGSASRISPTATKSCLLLIKFDMNYSIKNGEFFHYEREKRKSLLRSRIHYFSDDITEYKLSKLRTMLLLMLPYVDRSLWLVKEKYFHQIQNYANELMMTF